MIIFVQETVSTRAGVRLSAACIIRAVNVVACINVS